jgi:RNA polymerase sigma-70 factor (ECF subfamily)
VTGTLGTVDRRSRFDDFYLFERPKLVAALTFVTGDADVAADAVDEACARAVERLRRGHEIDELGAWIRVVALNFARGRFRRRANDRKARARLSAQAGFQKSQPAIDTSAVLDVRAALAQLPTRQREVCVLYYFLDCSVREIAHELRTSEGNVKASLHRARTALAELLGEDEPTEVAP